MAEYCFKCMRHTDGQAVCPHCGYQQNTETRPHQLAPGTLLLNGRYLIGTVIGQGGFGITYVGRDLKLDLKVAVKEYYPNGYVNRNCQVTSSVTFTDSQARDFMQSGKEKFLQEARTLARFHGMKGVADVRDFFEENQTAYIVMEFLEGQDLRVRLRKKLFSAQEIFALMRPLLDDLEKIHAAGLIHRDISPDNIMLLTDGTLKLMDFGAARMQNPVGDRSTSVVLKPGYAPEEQYRTRGEQGAWTDIYALCATMYKCITGRTPEESLERAEHDSMKWPSELGYRITPVQEAVLKKGMAVKHADRFQNISELKAVLDAGQSEQQSSESAFCDDDDGDEGTEYWEHGSRGSDEKNEKQSAESGRSQKTQVNRLFLAGGLAAALMIFCVIMVLLNRKELPVLKSAETVTSELFGEEDTGPSSEITTETTTAVSAEFPTGTDLEEQAICHITLTPGDDTTIMDFRRSLELLEERLDVFAGEDQYQMVKGMDSVDLYLPKEAFGVYSVEAVLQAYLVRPIRLYGFQSGKIGTDQTFFYIQREDMEEVVLENGTIPNIDAVDYGYSDGEEYPYISLRFTDSFMEENGELIEAWGDEFLIVLDPFNSTSSTIWLEPVSSGDENTFYIMFSKEEQEFLKLTEHNLTHEELPGNLYYHIDLNNDAVWEEPGEGNVTGENQCAVSELTDGMVTISYTVSDTLTVGEQLDLDTALRERLDSLGTPYAIGKSEDTGNILVRLSPERIGILYMDLLGRASSDLPSYFVLQRGKRMAILYGVSGFTYEVSEDGTLEAVLSWDVSWDDLDEYLGYSQIVDSESEEELCLAYYLDYSDSFFVPLLGGGKITSEGVSLSFSSLLYLGNGEIPEDAAWALDYLKSVLTGAEMPEALTLNTYQFEAGADGVLPSEEDFSESYAAQLRRIGNKIAELDDRITWYYNDSETGIYVNLYLDVNETLPEKAVEFAKQIYEVSGFEDSFLQLLTIYLIDEDETAVERARITFGKDPSLVHNSEKDWYVFVTGSFRGGRLDAYAKEFQKLIEEDSFFQEKTGDHTSWNFGTVSE